MPDTWSRRGLVKKSLLGADCIQGGRSEQGRYSLAFTARGDPPGVCDIGAPACPQERPVGKNARGQVAKVGCEHGC